MSYLRNLTTMYAEAWLDVNGLKWSEENWSKAIKWACSHSAKECQDYLRENCQ